MSADVDQVMQALKVWVAGHHRTELTVSEASRVRHALRSRVRDQFKPKCDVLELVTLAHREANDAIDERRDRTQRAEHQRMARA